MARDELLPLPGKLTQEEGYAVRLLTTTTWLLLAMAMTATPGPAKPGEKPAPAPGATVVTRILAVGDSITDGYGLDRTEAWPALLQQRILQETKRKIHIVNAGTPGATSAFGIRTIRFHIKRRRPDLIVLALGGNDSLRGLPVEETRRNLQAAIDLAREHKIPLLLAGMQAPPNNGPVFTRKFNAIFKELHRTNTVPLVPFLLEGVAGERQMNQADGIHPNAAGQKVISQTIWIHIKELL